MEALEECEIGWDGCGDDCLCVKDYEPDTDKMICVFNGGGGNGNNMGLIIGVVVCGCVVLIIVVVLVVVMVMKFRRCIEEFIRTAYTSKSLLRAGGFNLLCRTVCRR